MYRCFGEGRDSSVGIAARYGLDGAGTESRWGRVFRTRPDRPWAPSSLLYNGYRVFPGGKTAGAWFWPPTLSSVEVKERVYLYLYSPFGPSWPVLGCTLSLSLTLLYSSICCVLYVCLVLFWELTTIASPDNLNLLSFSMESVLGVK